MRPLGWRGDMSREHETVRPKSLWFVAGLSVPQGAGPLSKNAPRTLRSQSHYHFSVVDLLNLYKFYLQNFESDFIYNSVLAHTVLSCLRPCQRAGGRGQRAGGRGRLQRAQQ